MPKEKYRFNYYMSSAKRAKKAMDSLSNYYDINSIVTTEELCLYRHEHELDSQYWDCKMKKLLPILMKRFSNTEVQIFYSCMVSSIPYTQTDTTKFATYRDKNGKKEHYTQAAINGYIKRIEDIIVREDEHFEEGLEITKDIKTLLLQANKITSKLSLYLSKNKSKLIMLTKTREELKSFLKIIAIEKKIKLIPILDEIRGKIEYLRQIQLKEENKKCSDKIQNSKIAPLLIDD